MSIRGHATLIAATVAAGVLAGPLGGCANASSNSASNTTAGTITLAPQAVTLANPSTVGAPQRSKRIAVSLKLLDAAGHPLTRGQLSSPIQIRVYGPSSGVLRAEKSVIRSPQSTIYFRYSGGFLANSIIVTAVSGHAFGLMSFQPQHRGFPGTQSVAFPMPDGARNMRRGWGFSASIGGGPQHYVQMDTGSRGIVVPASAIGRGAVGPGPKGMIEYTSSGKEFFGNYYLAPVKLSFGGATATTVPIRVLGVDRAACAPGYPNCVAPKNIGGLMGVGFARGKSSSMAPELTNAFLALQGVIQGSMHPGYVVRSTGVTLGITAADQAGFDEAALTPGGTGPGDWNTKSGCFSFPGISGYGARCGTVLVDTGIASAILALPRSQRPRSIASSIPAGERVLVTVGSNPILSYGFAVGDGGTTTPTSIRWAGGTTPFVNTGRRLISRNDYLFDAGSGKLGFKPA